MSNFPRRFAFFHFSAFYKPAASLSFSTSENPQAEAAIRALVGNGLSQ